jgi:hypothetical protein
MPILGPLRRYAGRRARAMAPSSFIKKGKASNLKERSAAHEHFTDLCRLLDKAVAQAYAWKSAISDDDMLIMLLALNLERAKEYPKLCRA